MVFASQNHETVVYYECFIYIALQQSTICNYVDRNKSVRVGFLDLSIAFASLSHKFLIEQLKKRSLSDSSGSLWYNFLQNFQQRAKWTKLYLLDPLRNNEYLSVQFSLINNPCTSTIYHTYSKLNWIQYSNGTTLYTSDASLLTCKAVLEQKMDIGLAYLR